MNIADDLVRAYDDGYVQGKADAVVHGHWIVQRSNYNEKFECSVCQHISKDGGNYCSNCGAKMEVNDGSKTL